MSSNQIIKNIVITFFVLGLGIVGYVTLTPQRTVNVINIPVTGSLATATISTNEGKQTTPTSNKQSSDPVFTNNCTDLVSSPIEDYYLGWKNSFQEENNLSELQYAEHITVNTAALRPIGNTCEFEIDYLISRDWISVTRTDRMTLGVPPNVSPTELPHESDPLKPGRSGISGINLHDKLAFKNATEAMQYFADKYSLQISSIANHSTDFQYFWDREQAEKSSHEFAGSGGEPYLSISGILDDAQNKCYQGQVSLISKQTIYREHPCRIY